MKVRIEIPMEEAFTLEERMNFEANARLAGRDLCSHLRAILFPPAVANPRATATKALALDHKGRAEVNLLGEGDKGSDKGVRV